MSDLRTRTWRALEAHGLGWIDNGKPDAHCWCGHRGRLGESWHFHVADVLIRELDWNRIVDYCEQQAAVGWRDIGTADEAMGRNIVAEAVLTIMEGTADE